MYRRIDHPAVGEVACPYCHQAQGVPCTYRDGDIFTAFGTERDRKYVQTHLARVLEAGAKRLAEGFAAHVKKVAGVDVLRAGR